MRDQEKAAKPHQLAQTGWCGQEFLDHTTPPPAEEGSRLLQLSLSPIGDTMSPFDIFYQIIL